MKFLKSPTKYQKNQVLDFGINKICNIQLKTMKYCGVKLKPSMSRYTKFKSWKAEYYKMSVFLQNN